MTSREAAVAAQPPSFLDPPLSGGRQMVRAQGNTRVAARPAHQPHLLLRPLQTPPPQPR